MFAMAALTGFLAAVWLYFFVHDPRIEDRMRVANIG
jgi:hypothetical protein